MTEHLFPLRVPEEYLERVDKDNPNDPLLRQVLPLSEEYQAVEGFVSDPLEEQQASPIPGLLHKYHGRVLLIVTGACVIHCRYCFRRNFPYKEHHLNWTAVLGYLAAHTEVEEVILSGGDPLTLKDEKLSLSVKAIADIHHIKRLRIHTRIPVVTPSRVTDDMLHWLTSTRLKTVMVIHSNHANELDKSVESALLILKAAGICLLNQSVLLKGVNDSSEVLINLSQRLFECGVMPYYLHLLDKVEGASHFEVSEEIALSLMQELQAKLPGYLVPKLVRERAGGVAKELVF